MQLLKTIFWVVLAVALALFTKANWDLAPPKIPGRVGVKLWGDDVMYVRLPVLILSAFLLGLVPTWAWGKVVKWQLRRKLTSAERALESMVTPSRSVEPVAPTQTTLPTSTDTP